MKINSIIFIFLIVSVVNVKANNESSSKVMVMTDAELEQRLKYRIKDPFMVPNDIYAIIKKRQIGKSGDEIIDELAHPRLRWTLKYYKLVAVIWNVSQPKAMLQDRDGAVHMFKIGDQIGNRKGLIQNIGDGSVTVLESGKEVIIKMIYSGKKSDRSADKQPKLSGDVTEGSKVPLTNEPAK